MSNDERIKKEEFVKKLAELLRAGSPTLADAEYVLKENGTELVVVTAINGYKYKIDVTADSCLSLAYDVLEVVRGK